MQSNMQPWSDILDALGVVLRSSWDFWELLGAVLGDISTACLTACLKFLRKAKHAVKHAAEMAPKMLPSTPKRSQDDPKTTPRGP